MLVARKMEMLAVAGLCAAVLAVAVGCSTSSDDHQIVRTIQSQIEKDAGVGGAVTIESLNGVVTLNGHVASDMARALAAREAADAPGVKQVVNNLTVAQPASTESPAAAPAPAPAPAPAKVEPRERVRHVARKVARSEPAKEPTAAAKAPEPAPAAPPAAPPPPAATVAAAPPPAPEPPAPPPPPAPVKYTVPAGTTLSVRLIDALDSSRNRVGDTFRATLNAPVRVEGEAVIPAGADVEGRVVDVANAGRFAGHSELKLELTKLTSHGHVYPLQTQAYDRAGQGRGKGTAESMGGGAALGAIIGGLAGGGRGAAIGTLAGAGAGGAARGAKSGQPVHFPSETVLSFRLDAPVTVTIMKGGDKTAANERQ